MWGSKGRSGYGDSTIGGNYDSWDGISPNGRQYKNEATMETRDLSGWDYWHLRKQNRPTEEIPAHLHMLKNGRANIDVYGKLDQPKKQSKIDIRDKILPQEKRLSTLTQQLLDLEQEYKQGKMDIDEYSMYRAIAITRRDRAWILYCKAVGMSPDVAQNEDVSPKVSGQTTFNIDDVQASGAAQSTEDDNSFLASISEDNVFKNVIEKACKGWKIAVRYKHKVSNYIQTLRALLK